MRKIYFNLLIALIILVIFYYVFYYYYYHYNKEGFTPYIRTLNHHYEYFTTNFGLQPIFNKLRKWNIY